MHIQIIPDNGVPIYLQIVNQVKYLVASGRLGPGEEMPPIRALAERLLINPNTVARAYRELETAGIVTKRRTAGTFVSEAGTALEMPDRLAMLATKVDVLLSEARQLEIGLDALLALVKSRDEAMRTGRGAKDSHVH